MKSDTSTGGPIARPRALVIPYGIETLSAGHLPDREAGRALPFPCEVIDTGAGHALKLNNSRYQLDAATTSLAGMEPFEAIKQHLIGLCGTWSRPPQRFLEYYFGEVEAIVERARADLERRLAPCEGLFTYKDWRFSAPKPLPRAFLPVPDSEAAEDHSFVQVEFAFWLGDRMLALLSEPGPLTPRAAARRPERLARAGVECVAYGAADVEPGRRELIGRILSDTSTEFWSAETLPTGPFRPDVPAPT